MVPITPLFGPIPGGPELLIVGLAFLLPLGAGVWVYNDATAHGMDYAPIWGLAVTFGFVMWFLPGALLTLFYIYVREKEAAGPATAV